MATPLGLKQARDSRGEPIDDALTNYTAAANTRFYAVIPPCTGKRSLVRNFRYTNGATAHTLTIMPCLSKAKVTSDAAAAQAVLNVSALETYPDGTSPAPNDFIVVQRADGTWEGHEIQSITGLAITVTANFTQIMPAFSNNRFEGIPLTGWVYFMGAAADHPDRAFTMPVSVATDVYNPGSSWSTSLENSDPILVHSNNPTNAGTLSWLAYGYVSVP